VIEEKAAETIQGSCTACRDEAYLGLLGCPFWHRIVAEFRFEYFGSPALLTTWFVDYAARESERERDPYLSK
jgi:hypothetical protein